MIEYQEVLLKLVSELSGLPDGDNLAQSLLNEQDFIYWFVNSDPANLMKIDLVPGHAPQNLCGPPIQTEFMSYVATVIQPQILSGAIANGTEPGEYDDRKVRYHRHQLLEGDSAAAQLRFKAGPTTYQRYRQDLTRDKADAVALMLKGVQQYQDPFTYFSKAVGVTIVPILEDGTVYVGQRSANVDCPGFLNFVAGMATFYNSVEEINFLVDAQRELQEELDIDIALTSANTKFIGIAGNPFTSETDLVFVVQTDVNHQHFENRIFPEHTGLVPIKTKQAAEDLLCQGRLPNKADQYKLYYASRLGLEYLVAHHF